MVPGVPVCFKQPVRYRIMYWACKSICCVPPPDKEYPPFRMYHNIAVVILRVPRCHRKDFCAVVLLQSGQQENMYESVRRQRCGLVSNHGSCDVWVCVLRFIVHSSLVHRNVTVGLYRM